MLSFLPHFVVGLVSLTLIVVNTLLGCTFLFPAIFLKWVIPINRWRSYCSQYLVVVAETWVGINSFIFRLTQKVEWEVKGIESLRPDGWYLIIANHRSWVDIPVLQKVFKGKIPFLKFFIKQELLWVPLLGIAWWGLDFPIMKRYSREYLQRYPERQGKDMETTRRACEKFRLSPVSVINFLEGTRFTPAKHKKQNSPYRHLLLPKAGGIAFVLSAMGEYFTEILDVTLIYSEPEVHFWDLLSGRIRHITVHVKAIQVPEEALEKDYGTDPEFQKTFRTWVNELWRQKDELIERNLPTVTGRDVFALSPFESEGSSVEGQDRAKVT